MTDKWSDDEEERLIELWQERPSLFDNSSKMYSNSNQNSKDFEGTAFALEKPVHIVWLMSALWVLTRGQSCPHQEAGLRRWSDASQWPGGQIPADGADVVISDGVLLDQTTGRLNTITVESGGKLVWSPDGDFTLTVSYVSVTGEFHIGSEACPFAAKARIKLTGEIKTAPGVGKGNDQKVIAVLAGGTLEIHGKQKLSWTKLTKTAPSAKSSGLVSQYLGDSCQTGLNVVQLDASTGEVLSSERFKTKTGSNKKVSPEFQAHIQGIPDGRLVMIASCKVIFSSFIDKTPIFEAIETLVYGSVSGSGLIRYATPDSLDSYVALAIKGSSELGSEALKFDTANQDEDQEAVISRTFSGKNYQATARATVSSASGRNEIALTLLTKEAANPTLDLLDDSSTWLPGDHVFLTSTDYDMEQAEEAIVIECPSCTAKQIRLDRELKYTHWGELIDRVDERGEVALLSRYITIEGEVQDSCPPDNGNCQDFPFDTFGGHVKAIGPGFKNIHIEGAELYHMGQQMLLGRYPIHFHMSLDVDGSDYPNPPYVRECSIHHSFSRCITIHGTSGVTLMDNVGYDILGHCYFLEDGGEKRSTLDGNLGAVIRPGKILPTDAEDHVSVFWITNPLTTVINNVAGGSAGVGFWYIYPTEPFGPSKGKGFMQPYEARETAINQCSNNVAHSSERSGFRADNELDKDGFTIQFNKYGAKETPLLDGSPSVETIIDRLTAYKNRKRNGWARGGWWTVMRSSFADSNEGFTLAGGDKDVQFMNSSVFLGETPNIGEPTFRADVQYDRALAKESGPDHPVSGFRQYDGPVIVNDCWFNYFKTTDLRPSGAYTFTRFMGHPTSAVQPTFNMLFGFDDGATTGNRVFRGEMGTEYYGAKEGDFTATFRDLDGSMTGTAYSTVVRTAGFHLTEKCYTRANWGVSACPYRYGKLVVYPQIADTYAAIEPWADLKPFMTRDDIWQVKEQHLTDDNEMMGYGVILGQEYSYMLNWETKIPGYFKIQGQGVERDYGVRLGICLPPHATFDLRRSKSSLRDLTKWEAASSVAEVDQDDTGNKYFWDAANGLLFVKFRHSKPIDPYYERCPDLDCDVIFVTVLSGDLNDADCSTRGYGPYKKTITDTTQAIVPTNMEKTSVEPPQEIGAGETRPFPNRQPVDGGFGPWGDWEKCSVTCGGGTQIKRRLCDSPLPQHGGDNCDESRDSRFQTQDCNTQAC